MIQSFAETCGECRDWTAKVQSPRALRRIDGAKNPSAVGAGDRWKISWRMAQRLAGQPREGKRLDLVGRNTEVIGPMNHGRRRVFRFRPDLYARRQPRDQCRVPRTAATN